MFKNIFLVLIILVVASGCKKDRSRDSDKVEKGTTTITEQKEHILETLLENNLEELKEADLDSIPDGWKEVLVDSSIIFDLRYATADNFTGNKIYDCPRCFLRPHVYEELMKFKNHLWQKYKMGVIIYDCYRPRPYQKKLWDILPDPRFVTHPDKGSMHTRGMAVDLGLINREGRLLDMGTDFDHFGRKSFHSATNISPEAIKNRKLLKEEIGKFGFKPITSEWWHYSYRENIQLLSDWVWNCNKE